jgi:type I restriction enzyme, S subunit
MTWRETILGDVAEVSWGDTNTTKSSYGPTGYLAYSASGPDGFMGHFDHEGPGIVLSAIGAQCGKTWFADGKWSCIKNTIFIKGTGADTRFLYYALSSDVWQKRGAAQPFISQGDARRIVIRLPPFCVQKRIADILSAYDDLIENNARRIAIFEEVARRLFEEWFVRFRFPDAETTAGDLPAGWKAAPLGSVVAINPETIRPRQAPAEIAYIDIASVSPGQVDQIQHMAFVDAPGRARRIVRSGDVIWSNVRPNRRSFALLLNLPDNAVASTGFTVLRAKEVPWSYLLMATSTTGFVGYLTNRAKGSAYPAVGSDDFSEAEIVLPNATCLDRYHALVGPALEGASILRTQTSTLRKARDLIRPKLVSGEIDLPVVTEALKVSTE